MTNEQLHLLLKDRAARLRTAIEDVAAGMPEEAERETLRRHTREGCLGFMCGERSHYEYSAGRHLALAPAWQLLEEWEADAQVLAPKPDVIRAE